MLENFSGFFVLTWSFSPLGVQRAWSRRTIKLRSHKWSATTKQLINKLPVTLRVSWQNPFSS